MRTVQTDLTDRDQDLLMVLTVSVRVLSQNQIAKNWFGSMDSPRESARKSLSRLCSSGHLQHHQFSAHPLPVVNRPLVSWSPGEGPIDYGPVSYQLRRRWKQAPVVTTCYTATKEATRLLGGIEFEIRPLHVSHDLHFSSVFLHYRSKWPDQAKNWRSEEMIRSKFKKQKLPDAVILSEGVPVKMVESGGAYNAQRVEEFHEFCSEARIPYELW